MRKRISKRVSVGEQPREADLEELKKEGVTTVVNLRVVGEETPLTPAEERALAERLGLQYHHLPISLDKLEAGQVKDLREILQELARQPALSRISRSQRDTARAFGPKPPRPKAPDLPVKILWGTGPRSSLR